MKGVVAIWNTTAVHANIYKNSTAELKNTSCPYLLEHNSIRFRWMQFPGFSAGCLVLDNIDRAVLASTGLCKIHIKCRIQTIVLVLDLMQICTQPRFSGVKRGFRVRSRSWLYYNFAKVSVLHIKYFSSWDTSRARQLDHWWHQYFLAPHIASASCPEIRCLIHLSKGDQCIKHHFTCA